MLHLDFEPDYCQTCPLYGRRRVYGEGWWESPICLVGQSPGTHEGRKGRPFIGPAVKLLNVALKEAGLARNRIWITNTVKCVLPAGATVPVAAREACVKAFLRHELKANRILLIAVGNIAHEALIRLGYRPFHLTHPAAALRKAIWKARLLAEVRELKGKLNECEELSVCLEGGVEEREGLLERLDRGCSRGIRLSQVVRRTSVDTDRRPTWHR